MLGERPMTRVMVNTLLLTLAFASIVAAFNFAWTRYPQFLYLYRDGEYNLWISLQTKSWTTPFDLSSINPLQGMTSMLVTINPYFDPAQWVFFSELSQSMKVIISYSIYTLGVLLSTLALGITLGFSRLHSFIASIWVGLLLFPPFNFFFALGGWFAVAPAFAYTLAMSNLCLIICLYLGKLSYQPRYYTFCKNIFLIAGLIVLLIATLIAAPIYNAGLLLGIGVLLTCICLSSTTLEQLYWQIAAGFAVITVFYILGLPEFYLSAKAYSARFSENPSLITKGWKDIFAFNQENITQAQSMLCGLGMHCPAYPGWPISISTLWVNLAIIFGGFIAFKTMPKRPARIGLMLTIMWILLLLISVLLSVAYAIFGVGVFSSIITPSWFFLMMYSLCALYSLYILSFPIKIIMNHVQLTINSIQTSIIALIITVAISSWIIFSFHAQPNLISTGKGTETTMMANRHSVTPIIQLLQNEIALYPGTEFRGSVATIYGTSEGTLRKAPNVHPSKKVESGQFEEFLTAAAESGSTHDLLDLWTWNIPTLSEYGQGVSRPLMYYIEKFLSSPGDAMESHFIFPHKPNIDILRALGVRFVIVDAPLIDKEVTLRSQLNAGKTSTLFLYELANPNLGNYSPTNLLPFKDTNNFYQKISANPKRLETEAYVDIPISSKLTPAYDAKVIFQKRGVHVMAKSKGTSALLLPVQFSHCYRADGPNTKVKLMRANLLHTLIIFSGDLDTNLIWEYRWRHSKCRQQDVQDMKNLIV